jgi:hypothetical protein
MLRKNIRARNRIRIRSCIKKDRKIYSSPRILRMP